MPGSLQLDYYFNHECSICNALLPKLREMVLHDFPLIPLKEIDTKENAALAAQKLIFGVPVLLLQYEGQEIFRFAGAFSLAEVKSKINRSLQMFEEGK